MLSSCSLSLFPGVINNGVHWSRTYVQVVCTCIWVIITAHVVIELGVTRTVWFSYEYNEISNIYIIKRNNKIIYFINYD